MQMHFTRTVDFLPCRGAKGQILRKFESGSGASLEIGLRSTDNGHNQGQFCNFRQCPKALVFEFS